MEKIFLKNKLKTRLKYILCKKNALYPTNKKRVFVALAADYGNLGDLAITFAEIKILEKLFPEREIIECPISNTLSTIKTIKGNLKKDDVIFLVGGGNMSDKYELIELHRQLWIECFPDNVIISFPQSCDLDNSPRLFLQYLKKVYSQHKKMLIFARDEVTYNKLSSFLPNKVELFPDIVMSLGILEEYKDMNRNGILFCLRDDCEKSINTNHIKQLLEQCKSTQQVDFFDTCIDYSHPINSYDRDKYLKEVWKKFSQKKLIVTDRLHGVIFSYITNTPCLAFDNSNHKIKAFYNTWLKGKTSRVILAKEDLSANMKAIEQLLSDESENKAMNFSTFEKEILQFLSKNES